MPRKKIDIPELYVEHLSVLDEKGHLDEDLVPDMADELLLRLHRAMDLLKKNAGTVAEVAYSVGYGNSSHFAARFREIFGITPGDVRKTQDRPKPF